MSGTFLISDGISSDIRTVDFLVIVEAIRSKGDRSIVEKVLEPLDKGGVNMMRMDQLAPTEFKHVAEFMRDVYESADPKSSGGLRRFLEGLVKMIESDARCV